MSTESPTFESGTPERVSGPVPESSEIDRRVREAVVAGFAWAVGWAGVVWGVIYLVAGARSAAVYPFGFSVCTALNGLIYRRTGRFRSFARVEIALVLLVPALLTIHLGGLHQSGVVILWSSLAPIGAMMVLGRRAALLTLLGFIVAVVATIPSRGAAVLPSFAIDAFAVLDLVAVTGVAVFGVRTFVGTQVELLRQQRKVRALEQAWVAQEAILRQQERLATLGKLSAGVAHELNNPAAAAIRATDHLRQAIDRNDDAVRALLGAGVPGAVLEPLLDSAEGSPPDDPLERSDRVDALAHWLGDAGAESPWDLAETLVDVGIDDATLASAVGAMTTRQRLAVVHWVAETRQARKLLGEVRSSATRISDIVRALKGYSHMDRASAQRVDVAAGIEDTLVILRAQLAGIRVERAFDTDLPEIWGNAGELNQVWTNLIANAAEALGSTGVITLRVLGTADGVRVDVEDDGPGIPPDLIDHVFDPFVTTKAPGEGTGLGLNLVHGTIVERHRGRVTVESRPGRTCFTVTLPTHRSERDG